LRAGLRVLVCVLIGPPLTVVFVKNGSDASPPAHSASLRLRVRLRTAGFYVDLMSRLGSPADVIATDLVRGVVLLDNSGGDPSSVGHFKPLTPRPFTNGCEVLARPGDSRGPRASRTTTSTADLGCRIEIRLESLRHRGSILFRQVDRVVDAIERKSDLCCVLRAIEIVGDLSNRCFRHGPIVAGRGRPCLTFGHSRHAGLSRSSWNDPLRRPSAPRTSGHAAMSAFRGQQGEREQG
jgi:hypothetical protein